jgi:hypothetical protein
MRGVRWFVVVVLVAFCLPLLGCSKDSSGSSNASPPSQPGKAKDKGDNKGDNKETK